MTVMNDYRMPLGMMKSPYLDENIMLEPHTVADTDDAFDRMTELVELVNEASRHHGRPAPRTDDIPLDDRADPFWEDEANCYQVECEFIEYLDEFLAPYTGFTQWPDYLAIEARAESAIEDLSWEHAVYDYGDGSTPDEPDPHYRGLWIGITDHGNVTLYLRLNHGASFQDHVIWAVV